VVDLAVTVARAGSLVALTSLARYRLLLLVCVSLVDYSL